MSDGRSRLAEARAPRSEDRDTLRRRAAALARVHAAEAEADTVTVLVFELGGERYGIDAAAVLQVTPLRELTPLPGAAPPLLGVTYWRGRVLTVFDVRGPLGVRVRGLTDLGRLIVVEGETHDFGILADRATDMATLDAGTLRPLDTRPGADEVLIRGITDDAMLVIDEDALRRRLGAARTTHDGMRRMR
jgi:purine-binding chemotaxis protein CheW